MRAHIFLCMLAYYVEWHMRRALAPLLFEDEELDVLRYTRDPVAKAETSESAKRKKARLTTEDGFPVHSFSSRSWRFFACLPICSRPIIDSHRQ